MPELYLVRHGQASLGSANYDQLSPLGFDQARLLGAYFKDRGIGFDRVIIGAMARHKQTSDALLSALAYTGAEPELELGWNEFDFEGLVKAYLQLNPTQKPAPDAPKRAFISLLKVSLQAWANGELPESGLKETWAHFEQRVKQALAQVVNSSEKYSNGNVLVVSSGGAIAMALKHILQAPSETMISLNLQTANTAVSRCFFNAQGFSLHSFNHLPHLQAHEQAHQITFF